jgi:ABC-type phosphate/phosphonate transport system substrate-binding protein
VILARSDWVPSNALCVRKDLDPKLRKALQNALVGLGDDPGGKQVLASIGALGFVETTAKDYETVFELARAAGIDIRTYRYRID